MTSKSKLFEEIAREHLQIQSLTERGSSQLDTYQVNVAQLNHALETAYDAGLAAKTQLADLLHEEISHHAMAMMISKLQINYAQTPIARQAESEILYFSDQLYDIIGRTNYESLCEEMAI